MSDPVVPATPEPDTSFAAYVRHENAREQAGEPAKEPALVQSAPAPSTAEASVTLPSQSGPGEETATQQEPIKPAAAEPERNADGTFKTRAKSDDRVTNTGEWARNKRLTAELREAQAELERLRTAPAPAASPTPTTPAPSALDPTDPEPKLEQFLDRPDPYAALAVEAAKWAVREDRRIQWVAQQQAAAAEAQTAAEARIESFAAAHPDYGDKLQTIDDVIFDLPVLQAIADDDQGPAVAYYLAQHPEEARRVAALTPLEGVKAIGRLISRLEGAPSGSPSTAGVPSRAKPLIKPVSGSPLAPEFSPPDPNQTPFADWVRLQNAADRKRAKELRGA